MSVKALAQEILNSFDKIDKDKSGELDVDELVAAGFSRTQVEELMKLVDVDGDGQLSKTELEKFIKS